MHVTSWLHALLTPAVICGCGVTNHADRREAEPSSSGFGYVSKPAYLDHVRRVAALEILANEVDPADRVSGGAAVLWAAAIGGVSPCDLVLDASKGDVIITVLDGHGNCHRPLSGSDLLQRRGLEMVLLYGEHRFILHAWTTMKNLLRKRMNGLGYDFGKPQEYSRDAGHVRGRNRGSANGEQQIVVRDEHRRVVFRMDALSGVADGEAAGARPAQTARHDPIPGEQDGMNKTIGQPGAGKPHARLERGAWLLGACFFNKVQ